MAAFKDVWQMFNPRRLALYGVKDGRLVFFLLAAEVTQLR